MASPRVKFSFIITYCSTRKTIYTMLRRNNSKFNVLTCFSQVGPSSERTCKTQSRKLLNFYIKIIEEQG